ncbi:MAG: lytic transglycosylase domain-containing protein [Bdellovibrionales bacterium]
METRQYLNISRNLILFSLMLVCGTLNSAVIDMSDYQSVPVDMNVRQQHVQELMGKNSWLKNTLKLQTAQDTREAVHHVLSQAMNLRDKDMAARATRAVLAAAAQYQMDPFFILAMMKTESRFNPEIVGRHGEIGLMQILPETAAWIAARNKIEWRGKEALKDPVYNIRLGVAYVHFLRQSFKADSVSYVAAYNMGAANVRRLRAASIQPKIYSSKVLRFYQNYYANQTLKNAAIQATNVSLVD